MAFDGDGNDEEALSFPEWRDVLATANLAPAVRASHEQEIFQFLRQCRKLHAPATVGVVRYYLSLEPVQNRETAREALRWLFKVARGPILGAGRPGDEITAPKGKALILGTRLVPKRADEDLGGADWERDLVKAVRRKGHLSRTCWRGSGSGTKRRAAHGSGEPRK